MSEDKKPELHHLRESGSIEQDCDIAMLLYRPEFSSDILDANDDDDTGGCGESAEVIIAKQRNGRTGSANIFWNTDLAIFQGREEYVKYSEGKKRTGSN